MPRRPRTPQRLRELGAAAGEKVAAATRTAAKTGRVLVSKVRNYNRPTIECTETDADGRKCTRAFTVHKQIGEGAYSTVYKVCEWQPDGRAHIYAMKRVVAQDDESRRRARGEVELMRRLPPHPNILNLIAFHAIETEQGMTMHLLLEMCAHGSLAHYLIAKEGEPLGRPQVYRLFLDMAHALQHLHAQHPPVAHRDFKLENCLLATDGFAKLCDFGSATCRAKSYVGKREVDNAEDEFHRMCTAQYRSPEMFDVHRGHLVNEKVDVWALGAPTPNSSPSTTPCPTIQLCPWHVWALRERSGHPPRC
ncbi:kinase-like domain-containing protein [Pavlovales sp. CCMP2436]|nr:kinase-like domain-containing protein [Pavlovales sp. CCMP2436]